MRQTRGALTTFAGSERHQPVHSICCAHTPGVNPRDLLVCGTMSGVYAGVAPTQADTTRWRDDACAACVIFVGGVLGLLLLSQLSHSLADNLCLSRQF